MADIRIKDLAVTASSSASDDYLAVDGSTNGTRKLSAYSPTFGGNLTVSGTGTSSVAGKWLVGTTTDTGGRLVVDKASQAADSNTSSSAITVSNLAGGNAVLDIGVSSTYLGYLQTRNYTTGSYYQLNLQPAGGNVLIGTTTDLGQKLQVNGDGKFSGSVYAEKSGAGFTGQSTGAITQVTTVNSTTYNVTTGSAKVFVVQLASGDAALCYASYKSSTITILGSDGTIVNSSSPSSTQLGIYKSANDHVISFKTGSNALAGGYAAWGFCFLGNPVISIA